MNFAEELTRVLPDDLPWRSELIDKAAHHLALIVEANTHFNLTRITNPREAAIKHILDSVAPWRLFMKAKHVLDAGTGAGLPGIPLSVVLPEVRFTLSESTQKKAHFVEAAAQTLALPNVTVNARRAEDFLKEQPVDLITARAVAPVIRALGLFAPAIRAGARVLLYKGPDAELEIAEAAQDARKRQVRVRVVERYELPDGLGTRTIIEMAR
ncbi:MAG TPA: 16S rRNA (guanine(527)-N(7))-methyltransferase RsmG [Paludibaculum sp.]